MHTKNLPIEYEAWADLGYAVVEQAVRDWQLASIRLSKPSNDSLQYNKLKKECEWFFGTHLPELYAGMDGKSLLRRMRGIKL